MGLFRTIYNRIGVWFSRTEENLRDPKADLEMALKESRAKMARFQSQVSSLSAETKRLGNELKEKQAKKESYTKLAQKAVDAGNDDDARKILGVQISLEKEIATLTESIEKNRAQVESSRKLLNQEMEKIEAAESGKERLSVRLQSAEIRTETAKAQSSIATGDSPLSRLNDLEKVVARRESEAEAVEESVSLEQGNVMTSIEEKYGEAHFDVEEALQKMKAGKA